MSTKQSRSAKKKPPRPAPHHPDTALRPVFFKLLYVLESPGDLVKNSDSDLGQVPQILHFGQGHGGCQCYREPHFEQ